MYGATMYKFIKFMTADEMTVEALLGFHRLGYAICPHRSLVTGKVTGYSIGR